MTTVFFVNGILWILRTGAPWRDLPEHYGKWQSVATRFYRWQKGGIWNQILAKLQAMPAAGYAYADEDLIARLGGSLR